MQHDWKCEEGTEVDAEHDRRVRNDKSEMRPAFLLCHHAVVLFFYYFLVAVNSLKHNKG